MLNWPLTLVDWAHKRRLAEFVPASGGVATGAAVVLPSLPSRSFCCAGLELAAAAAGAWGAQLAASQKEQLARRRGAWARFIHERIFIANGFDSETTKLPLLPARILVICSKCSSA